MFVCFFKNNIYLLIFGCAGSSLMCRLFSSCRVWGLLSSGGGRILTVVTSLVECGLQGPWGSVVPACGLSRCDSQGLEHRLSSRGTRA